MRKPQKPAAKIDENRAARFIGGAGGSSPAATGEGETKRLNVNVPAALYDELKAKADSEGRSLTWLVTRWIEAYVSIGE